MGNIEYCCGMPLYMGAVSYKSLLISFLALIINLVLTTSGTGCNCPINRGATVKTVMFCFEKPLLRESPISSIIAVIINA